MIESSDYSAITHSSHIDRRIFKQIEAQLSINHQLNLLHTHTHTHLILTLIIILIMSTNSDDDVMDVTSACTQLDGLSQSLTELEVQLTPLLSLPLQSVTSQLTSLQAAKLQSALAYATSALFFS